MNQLKVATKIFLVMTLLTGVIYPLLITFIAQLTMPLQANGSLVYQDNRVIGSSLIAQNTSGNNYFWPRPSAIDYDPLKPSGGSNLGPTSRKLKDTVEERRRKVGANAPTELLYASGSGLDPHISLEAAYFQVDRIAATRNMDTEKLKELINTFATNPQLGFIGPRYVNVLLLNQALDKLAIETQN